MGIKLVKDYAYASLFDKKDLPFLYKLARKVRLTHDQSLVDDYLLKCQQKVDDHNPILQVGNKNIEFWQVSKSDDLVVTAGLDQCIRLIQATSTVRWQYMGYGSDQVVPPTTAQTALVLELLPRIDMSLFGWREYAGMTLRFAGIFGESRLTDIISEAGVFTAATGGTILNRNMFSTNKFTHTVNTSVFVISSVIEFVPVV